MFELNELNNLLQLATNPIVIVGLVALYFAYKSVIVLAILTAIKLAITKVYDFFKKPRNIVFGGRSISPEVEQMLLEQISRITQNPWSITLSDIDHIRKLIDNEKNNRSNL